MTVLVPRLPFYSIPGEHYTFCLVCPISYFMHEIHAYIHMIAIWEGKPVGMKKKQVYFIIFLFKLLH